MGKPEGRTEKLRLDLITLDPRLQCRASIDMATVDEYAEAIKAGVEVRDGSLPRVFEDTVANIYWLGDGWHWHHGSHKAGKKTMTCYVVRGTFQDALRYAVGANATHGRPRTPEDKRRAVLACLENDELCEHSTREIADLCRVSRDLVERVRGSVAKARPDTRVGKDGERRPAAKPGGRSATPGPPAPADLPPELADIAREAAASPHTLGLKEPEAVDAKGRPVPEALRPAFSDAAFAADVQALGKLAAKYQAAKNVGSPAAAFLSVQAVQVAVQNLQAAISSARPYIVCPACSGTLKEAGLDHAPECKLCRADGKPQGWLPAGKWSSLTADQKAVAESFKKGDAWEGDPA